MGRTRITFTRMNTASSMPSTTDGKHAAVATGATEGQGSVTKRLQTELMQLMMSGDASVQAFPEGDNLFSWIGTITGSPGTVYEGLSFKLSLKFPSGNGACYPYSPPVVKFETRVSIPMWISMATSAWTFSRISGAQCITR